jgi:hypothetical protein
LIDPVRDKLAPNITIRRASVIRRAPRAESLTLERKWERALPLEIEPATTIAEQRRRRSQCTSCAGQERGLRKLSYALLPRSW